MADHFMTETNLDLQSLRKLVRSKIIPNANVSTAASPFPWEIYRDLHSLGWLQAFIPQKLGGIGASAIDLLCMSREIGYGSSGVFSSVIVNMLAMTPIILYGSKELKEQLCQEFQERFFLWSYCMTEPDTGSNIAFSKTTAKRVRGGYLINGKKCFITNATYSEKLIVFASLEDSSDAKARMTCFYIPADSSGVTRGKPLKKLGQHDSNTGELFFDNVFVPEEHRIGEEGSGLKIAFHALQRSKTMIAGTSVGMCHRAYDLVTEHLAQRAIYSKPLLALPMVQNLIAQLQTETRAAWLLACDAAHVWDRGLDSGDFAIREASMSKMFASHTAVKYMNEAVELFGGYGFSDEYEIARLYRDCKVLEIYEGPTFVQQALISKDLFPAFTARRATEEKMKKAA